jgi:hypothetical protein
MDHHVGILLSANFGGSSKIVFSDANSARVMPYKSIALDFYVIPAFFTESLHFLFPSKPPQSALNRKFSSLISAIICSRACAIDKEYAGCHGAFKYIARSLGWWTKNHTLQGK